MEHMDDSFKDENTKQIGLTLKKIRKEKKLFLSNVEAETGIYQSTLTNMENGKRKVKITSLITLCKFYNVSSDYVLGLSSKKELSRGKTKSVDIYSTVKEDNGELTGIVTTTKKVDLGDFGKGDYFGLQIQDTSMKPMLMPNDYVIIKKQNYCASGCLAAVQIGDENIKVRVVENKSNETWFYPTNIDFMPYLEHNGNSTARILGVVVEQTRFNRDGIFVQRQG